MIIKAPLSDKEEVKSLCQSGAGELFCGFEPVKWSSLYGDLCISQRTRKANFSDLKDLEKAVLLAHRQKVKLHVALNGFFHSNRQYAICRKIIKDVVEIGADGVILADPALVFASDSKYLAGKDIIAGTDAMVFNSWAVSFYKRIGATRVVLPRSLTLPEISDTISRDPRMEYEAFIMNDLCFFEDGLCTYCKEQSGGTEKIGKNIKGLDLLVSSRITTRGSAGGCRSVFKRQKMSSPGHKPIGERHKFSFWGKRAVEGCGACALYDLSRMGVTTVKVLDRNMPLKEKVRSTLFIKRSLDFLQKDLSRAEFSRKCKKLFKKTFGRHCSYFECYYPWKKQSI